MKREPWISAALVALATGAWAGLFSLRGRLISPTCISAPELCLPARLWPIDALGYAAFGAYQRADELSYWSQNFSGAFLVGVIFLLTRAEEARRKLWLYAALMGTLLNGLLTESIRLIAQRPRPFVLMSPSTEGLNPAHYTSFVSGHTSFSTMACALAVIICLREGHGVRGALPFALALPVITAVCRVLAGRHYVTDTVGGALVGLFSACLVAAWLVPSRPRSGALV